MPDEIVFFDVSPNWEFDRDCLSFPAKVNNIRVKCLVTAELLFLKFGAKGNSENELRSAYEKHISEIRQIAKEHMLAGQIAPNNEVLLTSRVFRLKRVIFGRRLQQHRELFSKARDATEVLEDVIGRSAGLAEAEWDRGEDSHGRTVITLRLSDWTGSVTSVFAPDELSSKSQVRFRVLRIWGDLLQMKSHDQLQELQNEDSLAVT